MPRVRPLPRRPTRAVGPAQAMGRGSSAASRTTDGAAAPDGAAGTAPEGAPGTVAGGPHGTVVDCAVYRDGRRVAGSYDLQGAVAEAQAHGGFVWLGLYEPTEQQLAEVARTFDLHPLPIEDALKGAQRPKLERYDDEVFAVLKTVAFVEHDPDGDSSQIVVTGEVLVFLGHDFVVTVRHGRHSSLGVLRHRLESQPELLCRGPSAVLHAVADLVVDGYVEVAEDLREDLDDVEGAVFTPRRNRSDVERIYLLKREILKMKRAIEPLALPMQGLCDRPIDVVQDEVRHYFRDVQDHLTRVRNQVDAYDELLTSILQASLAQVSVAENEDMRKITAWAAIIAVPTLITGIYGMNFDHMPELHWRYGYPAVLVLLVLVCVLLYRGFRRNGWL